MATSYRISVPGFDKNEEQNRRKNEGGGCKCIHRCFRTFCPCLASGTKCVIGRCDCENSACKSTAQFPDLRNVTFRERPFRTIGIEQEQAAQRSVTPMTQQESVQDVMMVSQTEDEPESITMEDQPSDTATNVVGMLRRLRQDEIAQFLTQSGNTAETLFGALSQWTQSREEQENAREDISPWCRCKNCFVSGSVFEDTCCLETPCVTRDPYFMNTVTDRDSLLMAMLQRNDLMATHDRGTNNTQFRYHAYRSFILWKWGWLGKGNRQPLPSCAYKAIRSLYPKAPHEEYTQFKQNKDLERLTHCTQ